MIRTNTSKIPRSCDIDTASAEISCDHFEVGENAVIGRNVKIHCKTFIAGDNLYMTSDVEVGRGGCTGPDSEVIIGDNVGIFEGVVLNPSDRIEIGDNVGIGTECLIWTHGAWLDITQGFPAEFGPVKIGNNVWLPARSIVMPNITIGDNCVIGTGSIITCDIPSGSLAAGTPCKVIKENYYPRDVDIIPEVEEIIRYWHEKLLPHKGVDPRKVEVEYKHPHIDITEVEGPWAVSFDIERKKMLGEPTILSEDFRDFLRRRGIKIYLDGKYKDRKFRSLFPSYIRSL